jgi:hypothetical protein
VSGPVEAACAEMHQNGAPLTSSDAHGEASELAAMIEDGTRKIIDGRERVFYDGYWVQTYDVPADTLLAKRTLIEALTRRLFNHVEHGINIPGRRLAEARRQFADETDPESRRVKGAMLAGCLFNRAMDIFTKVVELQQAGIEIPLDDQLMKECGKYLQEALTLGKLVLHRSGEEGIDELWGEPFRAFVCPIEAFYEGRYIKIAQTMRDIDRLAESLIATFSNNRLFQGIESPLRAFANAAKRKSETLRTDPLIFDIWSTFVVSAERLTRFQPGLGAHATDPERRSAVEGLQLVCAGKDLVSYITRARVPMPKSTREFIERCQAYRANLDASIAAFPA